MTRNDRIRFDTDGGIARPAMSYSVDMEDRRSEREEPGEEQLRFIRNFNDIFIAIGLSLLATGLAIFSTLSIAQLSGLEFDDEGIPGTIRRGLLLGGIVYAIDAAIMWGIGEIFRSRRLFLPSIIILVSFVGFVLASTSAFYGAFFGEIGDNITDISRQAKAFPLIAAAAGLIASLFYYARMKLPFAMGSSGAFFAGFVIALVIFFETDFFLSKLWWFVLGAGLFLFLLGVYFDARDPERRTRISDNGFWLHFFAAPLIFYSVIQLTIGGTREAASGPGAAIVTLMIVFTFAIVSLLINRRALLVAGLLSAMLAVGALLRESGIDGMWTAGLTLLILGGSMVLLGGGWKTVRRWLTAPFPKSGPVSRIVPPDTVID